MSALAETRQQKRGKRASEGGQRDSRGGDESRNKRQERGNAPLPLLLEVRDLNARPSLLLPSLLPSLLPPPPLPLRALCFVELDDDRRNFAEVEPERPAPRQITTRGTTDAQMRTENCVGARNGTGPLLTKRLSRLGKIRQLNVPSLATALTFCIARSLERRSLERDADREGEPAFNAQGKDGHVRRSARPSQKTASERTAALIGGERAKGVVVPVRAAG